MNNTLRKILIVAALIAGCRLPAMADSPAVSGILAQTSLTANVTGNAVAQTVNVGNAVPCGAGGLVLVGGYFPELTIATAVPSSTSISAIFLNSHSAGD